MRVFFTLVVLYEISLFGIFESFLEDSYQQQVMEDNLWFILASSQNLRSQNGLPITSFAMWKLVNFYPRTFCERHFEADQEQRFLRR